MENKQLTKYTLYDLYGKPLEQLEDDKGGRFATLICEYMLTDKEIIPPGRRKKRPYDAARSSTNSYTRKVGKVFRNF